MVVDKNGWERFKGEPVTAFRDRLHATIGKEKKILINRNLYFAWGSPAAVYLFFNRRLKQIALMPADAKDTSAFPVRSNGSGGYQIMAVPFCQHYNIQIRYTHKFIRPEITDDGQLILDLTNTIRVSRRTRTKPGRNEV